MKSISEIVDRDKFYEINAGLELVKKTAKAKFDESIDAAIKLGIDPKKSDQLVRGALVLPSGTGKTTRVAVFAQGDAEEEAKKVADSVLKLVRRNKKKFAELAGFYNTDNTKESENEQHNNYSDETYS